jgi:hypothetical protein
LKEVGCIYNTDGACYSCIKDFVLTKEGKCEIRGCSNYDKNGCTTCRKPFVMNYGKCEIPSCVSYNDDCCTLCLDGFALKNK